MASRPKLDEVRDLIRSRGVRATRARMVVLDLLRASGQPMSHGQVAERLAAEGWDQATLYRNLIDLSEIGLVRRTDMGDHVWRFEIVRDDHDPAKHPHFICTECGTVECLPVMEIVTARAKIPKSFKQRQVEVQVRGLCDACG